MSDDKTRSCRWCLANYGEKPFKKRLKNTCDSCARMRDRDRCSRCNGPKFKKRCGRCDPAPEGKVEVIVIDKTSDDERILYRSRDKSDKINVAGKRIPMDPEEDLIVISLSRKEFLSTLC